MRALVQRVSRGIVNIEEENYSAEIGKGFVILLGIKSNDDSKDVEYCASKCANLRVFEDEAGKMNLSLNEVDGEVLIISQFTLYGNTSKGNRPNFMDAARPEYAIPLYEEFVMRMKNILGEPKVKTGIFSAMMEVTIVNDGPVTIMVESDSR
ncbi:MAG: D-aminoacyl-tRNA deacylase [Ignavibacteria bacterium]|nr:D-aminoacyl-tRNA deacylase [Ignavibacteria bacterium]MDP3830133.1 D-aminoacyl-tRNA deacylase [Ignavibacteriaceae bacterium]